MEVGHLLFEVWACTSLSTSAQKVGVRALQFNQSSGDDAGLLYCMEYLEQNQDWLQERLQPLQKGGAEMQGCYANQ